MSKEIEEVTIRTYPKIIFFWPTVIASALLGLFAQFIPIMNVPPIDFTYQIAIHNNWILDWKVILGLIWFGFFISNLFTVSFDYSSSKVLALVLFFIAGILLLIILIVLFPNLDKNIPHFSINILGLTMSFEFYYGFAGIFALVFLFIWAEKRWNYYKINSQEIVHKTGILGDLERFPAPNTYMHKKIADVFEFLLLKSGELTIIPTQANTIIHLPVVININKKEKEIQQILEKLEVEVDKQ